MFVPILHYLTNIEILKLQGVWRYFYDKIVGIALQSVTQKVPLYVDNEIVGYEDKIGSFPIRKTVRWLCKIEFRFEKIVCFYSSPFSNGFAEFDFPSQLTNMKIDNMVLVEPCYIFALGIDYNGNEAFLCYNLASKVVTQK